MKNLKKLLLGALTVLSIACVASACAGGTSSSSSVESSSEHEHSYVSSVTQQATCTETGVMTYMCDCGDSYTETIDAFGHDKVQVEAKTPTCAEFGWNAYEYCTRCDYSTYQAIPATGNHNFVDGECTECGSIDHDHEWDEGVVTTEPTCLLPGVKTYTCWCTGTITVSVAALGHDKVQHDGQAATCTEIGWEAYETCSRCDYTTYKEIAALGHTWSKICTNCGERILNYFSEGLGYLSFSRTYSKVTGIGSCKDTDIVIPSTYNDLPVTEIGNEAFYGCSSLTSVVIPDSVTSIGEYAFYNCRSLTSVIIGNGVTYIGDYAFAGCPNLQYNKYDEYDNALYLGNTKNPYVALIKATSTDITYCTIHNSTKAIHSQAFYNCSSLTSVEIPDSVTSIGSYAFYNCSSLTSMTIPFVGAKKEGTSYTHFGYLFGASSSNENYEYVPSSLTTVVITGGKSIGDEAFYECRSLTSVVIPDSVTSINSYAFYGCSSLTSVTIGNGVTSIGDGVFYNCRSLTSIEIPDSVTSIGNSAFCGCWSLTSVIIPDGVTYINDYTFYSCRSLTSVIIPDSVTYLGSYVFWECYSLGHNRYDNARYLGNENNPYVALIKATSTDITSCTIHNNTKVIYSQAFYNCSSLTSLVIPDSVTSIAGSAFSGCNNLQYNEYDNAKYLGNENNPYFALIKATSTSITSCTIHNNTKVIAAFAFSGCSNLTSMVIPDSVITIGEGVFYKCSSLTSVTIGNSVTRIDADAFAYCRSLTSVIIPDSVTMIGRYAFRECRELTITFYGTKDQWIAIKKERHWNYDYTVRVVCTDV